MGGEIYNPTGGWAGRYKNRQADGRADIQTDRRMGGQIYKPTGRWSGRYTNRQADGRADIQIEMRKDEMTRNAFG